MKRRLRWMILLEACLACTLLHAQPATAPAGRQAPADPLPPTHWYDPAYQRWLYDFLGSREYEKRGWTKDKEVRDTGPYINGKSYGTHNSVRVFYSPEVMTWLTGGRRGSIPDGAMIVKEMFKPPAARYDSLGADTLRSLVSGWAVMIRDSMATKDGWYWSYYDLSVKPDDPAKYPYDYPNSGIGLYCVRCHASAESEFTFASLTNVEGFPGDPITFHVDNSWLAPAVAHTPAPAVETDHSHERLSVNTDLPVRVLPAHMPEAIFQKTFNSIPPLTASQIESIPPLTWDHVVVGPGGPEQFVTSDQCLSCHDAQPPNLGPNMYIPDSAGRGGTNLSPYGEWNWSMMGLAGRDPIFHAQLESEITLQPTHSGMIQNLCFTCHGVMGQRQFVIDHPGELFKREFVQVSDPSNPFAKYGALARDGISCALCHQIVDDKGPLDSIFTGRFKVSTPGEFEKGFSRIYGPFTSPAPLAMRATLGMTPMQSDYVKSSRLCGGCHTVHLPVFTKEGKQIGTFFEQATYLEWVNSSFQNEFGPGDPKTVKTCQNCHMPTRFPDDETGTPLAYRIANIQDRTYPQAEHRAPLDSITVPIRKDFARHTLLGINMFGLEMFNQFDSLLGVRKTDYMTGSPNGLPFAISQANFLAKKQTAKIEITDMVRNGRRISAHVKVTNLAGHRFPSGVGFRRAFLEVKVVDPQGRVLWISGRTNELGVILGKDGKPLPSEFHEIDPATGRQAYQPHHLKVSREDQVQIFEELIQSPEGTFSTSFLNLAKVIKDNRLLPLGWTPKGPPGFKWQEATMPHGVDGDPVFTDGTASDVILYEMELPESAPKDCRVVATLYYQSIPPNYLRDRFTTVPGGTSTQRLHYIAGRLKLRGTPIENWKLEVASTSLGVLDRGRRGRVE